MRAVEAAGEDSGAGATRGERLAGWFDGRLGIHTLGRRYLRKVFPDHWSFLLGEICLYSFVVLVLTGVYLTLFFDPSMNEVTYHGSYVPLNGVRMSEAYASTLEISFDVRGGLLIRQLHHWAALVFVAGMLTHMMRHFFTGSFRRPREVNWVFGWLLLFLGLFEGLFGYSLPDDLLSGTGLRFVDGALLSVPVAAARLVPGVRRGPGAGHAGLGDHAVGAHARAGRAGPDRGVPAAAGLHRRVPVPGGPVHRGPARAPSARPAPQPPGPHGDRGGLDQPLPVLLAGGGNDIAATRLHLSINTVTWAVRIAVFAVPALVFVVTRRVCLGLQLRDKELVAHGRPTGVIKRLPHGEYVEVHEPLDRARLHTLTAHERPGGLVVPRPADRTAVEPVTRAPGRTPGRPG